MNRKLLSQAVKLSMPVFFGYVSIGIPFGLLMVQSGYPFYLPLLMSLFMYTGSGQYFAIGLFAAGAKLPEILIAEFLLSIRHTFYGISLFKKYRALGKWKPYLIYSITDETFAIISGLEVPEKENAGLFYTLISALDQFYWCLGTLIGSLLCSVLLKYNLADCLQGLDFALTAMFTVLFIENVRSSKNYLASAAGLAVTLLVVLFYRLGFFSSSNIIWSAICLGLGVMMIFKGPSFFKSEKQNKIPEEK